MASKRHKILVQSHPFTARAWLVVGLTAVALSWILVSTFASGGMSFNFEPSSFSVKNGDTFEVKVWANSGTNQTTQMWGNVAFEPGYIEFQGYTKPENQFEDCATLQFTDYVVTATCWTNTGTVAGRQLLGTLTFKTTQAGAAQIALLESSGGINEQTNQEYSSYLVEANVAIAAIITPTPPPADTPTPSSAPIKPTPTANPPSSQPTTPPGPTATPTERPASQPIGTSNIPADKQSVVKANVAGRRNISYWLLIPLGFTGLAGLTIGGYLRQRPKKHSHS